MPINLNSFCKTAIADTLTPLGMYLRIRDRFPGSLLLESNDSHAQENCMTYICIDPITGFKASGLNYQITNLDSTVDSHSADSGAEVLEAFKAYTLGCSVSIEHEYGEELINGFFGYSAFDAIQYFEDIKLNSECDSNRKIPDLWYQVYRYVIAVNHFRSKMYLLINTEKQELEALAELTELEQLLSHGDLHTNSFKLIAEENSNLTEAEHRQMIENCKKHIFRGDVFQIVPSRRFEQEYRGDDMLVYRSLRSINPSPYLFYFDYGGFRIFGSSPEAELVTANGQAMLYPIAGTYKRTGDDIEDARKVEELKQDPKENAEHVMLVDLARNDLSRFCKNVRVEKFKSIKYFSHVIHLESEVLGDLEEDTLAIDLLAASFPAGTLSGAPKYRAIELIDQYEPDARSYYGGAIGLIGFDGKISNHAIMIRSFLSKNRRLFYQAGGGVVADSVVESEVQEVSNKLGALRQAILHAQEFSRGTGDE